MTDVCCVTTDIYVQLLHLLYFSVEEADVEDEAVNIIKEVYVQPVAPVEFHVGYRLASEDLAIFSNGGEDDRDG